VIPILSLIYGISSAGSRGGADSTGTTSIIDLTNDGFDIEFQVVCSCSRKIPVLPVSSAAQYQ
jgi:hypothetical protein